MRAELWLCYRCATHGGAIFKRTGLGETGVVMGNETTKQKDTMKVEKLSLLVLTLCIVVLVYVLVARPFQAGLSKTDNPCVCAVCSRRLIRPHIRGQVFVRSFGACFARASG